jgi:polyhydroxybutyrate depolymerase
MRHLSVIVPVVLGPLLVGAEIHEATPAQLKRFTLVCDDRERTYFVHYPASKLPAEPKAVVFVLHGGGGADAQEMARRTGMNHIADREDFIVVYPQGIDGQWNDGRGKTFRRPTDNRDVDDVRFISAVIDELVGKKLADPSRVYVMGLSNGGMMTHRLGIELGHRLAAIAPVIANLPENIATQKPTRPLPVLIMNGTDDPMMPWNGGPVRVLGREYGTVLSTDHTVRYWVEAAQLPPNPRTRVLEDRSPEDGCTVEVVEYSAAGNPVEVVLYRIREGGHNLPGGNTPDRPVLLGRKCMDIVGVEVIWSFFKKHVLPKNAPTQPAAGSKRAAADWRPKVTQVNDPQANNYNAEFTGDGCCMLWIEGVGSLSTILVCLAAPARTQQPTSRGGLAERFKQLDRNGDGNKRLLVAEPDGNRFNIEQAPAAAIRAAATRAAATGTPKPHKEEVAEQRPGEPPFDIFVRWKPLAKQPIGWEPDINDGVRMNIRPFLASDLPLGGRTGAGILRWRPKVKWDKDRGKEPDRPKTEYPWFWGWDERTLDFMGGSKFDGNRWNDCQYTNKTKQAARDAAKKKGA